MIDMPERRGVMCVGALTLALPCAVAGII